jgi:hypothetical protein
MSENNAKLMTSLVRFSFQYNDAMTSFVSMDVNKEKTWNLYKHHYLVIFPTWLKFLNKVGIIDSESVMIERYKDMFECSDDDYLPVSDYMSGVWTWFSTLHLQFKVRLIDPSQMGGGFLEGIEEDAHQTESDDISHALPEIPEADPFLESANYPIVSLEDEPESLPDPSETLRNLISVTRNMIHDDEQIEGIELPGMNPFQVLLKVLELSQSNGQMIKDMGEEVESRLEKIQQKQIDLWEEIADVKDLVEQEGPLLDRLKDTAQQTRSLVLENKVTLRNVSTHDQLSAVKRALVELNKSVGENGRLISKIKVNFKIDIDSFVKAVESLQVDLNKMEKNLSVGISVNSRQMISQMKQTRHKHSEMSYSLGLLHVHNTLAAVAPIRIAKVKSVEFDTWCKDKFGITSTSLKETTSIIVLIVGTGMGQPELTGVILRCLENVKDFIEDLFQMEADDRLVGKTTVKGKGLSDDEKDVGLLVNALSEIVRLSSSLDSNDGSNRDLKMKIIKSKIKIAVDYMIRSFSEVKVTLPKEPTMYGGQILNQEVGALLPQALYAGSTGAAASYPIGQGELMGPK